MTEDPAKSRQTRQKPRFMYSTEASRAQKLATPEDIQRFLGATPQSTPISKRNHLFQRATDRLTSLSTGKGKQSRIGRPSLRISSPIPQRPARPTSLRLSSPSRQSNYLPEPVKKAPLGSPTSTDKPLPSLPIATLVSRSPIQRRSLIDATEKPLCKSVSPNLNEEWPALSPARPTGKKVLHGNSTMEKDSGVVSTLKPSLGESFIERMCKLNLNGDEAGHGDNLGVESKIKGQSVTPRIISIPKNDDTATSTTILGPTSMKPRRVPGIPFTKQRHHSSESGVNGEAYVQASDAPDARDGPVAVRNRTELGSFKSDSRPASVVIPNPLFSNSSIPQPHRSVSAAGSPSSEPTQFLTKVIQLKHVRGQIGGRLQHPSILGEARLHEASLSSTGTEIGDLTSTGIRRTSLPVPKRVASRQSRGKIHDNKAMDTLAMKQESSPIPETKLAQSFPVSSNTTKQDREDNSSTRNSRFPQATPDDAADDNQSSTSQSRSVSSATSGTIYAYDQFGSFRLKPVSVSNPKHGPRVRIEDSADRLLLDDESLAKCNAKRETYKSRYKADIDGNTGETDAPELTSLRTSNEKLKDAETKTEERNDSACSEATLVGGTNGKNVLENRGAKRLAPPIPVNIPSVSHSPTGWPLLVSKIAPFAELNPEEQSPKNADKRKSVSESNLRSVSTTPVATPVKGSKDSGQNSPGSAYTLRTALSKGPSGSLLKKTRRSFPNISVARPLFPPRTLSNINDSNSPSVKTPLSFAKQTSDMPGFSSDQRANFRSSPPSDERDQNQTPNQPLNQVQASKFVASSSPQHMQSYNDSIRTMDTHEDMDANIPSSPLAVPGSVNTGKGVMSNIKGLFHKHSTNKMMKSESSDSLSPERRASVRMTAEAFKPSPLRTTFDPNTPITTPAEKKHTINDSIKRKFSRLHRDKPEEQNPTNNTDPHDQASSSHPFMTSALEPLEIRDATALAFTLLDKARDAANEDARCDYVELAKLLVSTVTLSREAEKAVEEARQAAARAEIEGVKTRKAVGEITDVIRGVLDKTLV